MHRFIACIVGLLGEYLMGHSSRLILNSFDFVAPAVSDCFSPLGPSAF